MQTPQRPVSEIERITMAKVTRRLIPLMFICYIVCIIDRANINVASLTMPKDLGFSESQYGFGVGIFFLGYFVFEIPSNLIMQKVGARKWFARIMLSWGLVAALMMYIKTPFSLYATRFLLGVAEAGFFPGMVIYMTYWFPRAIRARAAARFMVASVVGPIIGSWAGDRIMKLPILIDWARRTYEWCHWLPQLKGWQWLFLIEGIPAVILGVVVYFYLTDRPEDAHWLAPEERNWLIRKLQAEEAHRLRYHNPSLLQVFAHPMVLMLCSMFFLRAFVGGALGPFGNLLLKQRSGWGDSAILWIGQIPAIVGAIVMMLVASHSDRVKERRRFVVYGWLAYTVGITLLGLVRGGSPTLAALTINSSGDSATNGPFWAMTTSFLSGTASAGGIALINAVGNLGNLPGGWLMGLLKDRTHNYELCIFMLAPLIFISAILASRLRHEPPPEEEEEEEEVVEQLV